MPVSPLSNATADETPSTEWVPPTAMPGTTQKAGSGLGFFVTLVYISLLFLSPASTFPEVAAYRPQVTLAVIALLATVYSVLTGALREQPSLNPQFALAAAFTLWVCVSWWPHGWIGGFFLGANDFLPNAVPFFLIASNAGSLRRLSWMRLVLLGLALLLISNGIYDYYFVGGSSPYVYSHIEPSGQWLLRLQALGLLGDPNVFAQFLLVLLPLLFVNWSRTNLITKCTFVIPASIAFLYAVYLTHSRGALLGIGLLMLLVLRRRFSALGGTIGTAAVMAILAVANFTGGRDISVGGGLDRLACWSEGLGMVKASPIWGVGYQGFTNSFELTAHNSFLLCAAELGLVGYFFWLSLIIVTLWQLRRIRKADDAPTGNTVLKSWANVLCMSFYSFLITAFFLSQTYAPILYVLLGMSAVIIGLDIKTRHVRILPGKSLWPIYSFATCVASLICLYISVRMRAF